LLPPSLLFYASPPPPHLPSFPTRRSSDLRELGGDESALARLAEPVEPLALVLVGARLLVPQRPQLVAAEEVGKARDDRCLLRHLDRKSTRLNSSHVSISYAVFCLKKKIKQ